ncbi:MAG: zinc-ribbon domain-containing protein, partial [Myxococcales bacterium]|nr:zinc-ribbon domain-containing protein [Myxococcales bacterium]
MKIECDKCGAKYSIADEKVRGKTFKIRCKKCSNVIIVRDKADGGADEAAAGAADPDQGPEQDAGGDLGWHLAIDGDTVGPLSEQEVRDRFAAGEIDRDTSVWQEGFDDWLTLGEVDLFSDLMASAPAAAAAPEPEPEPVVAAAPAADPFGGGDEDYSSGFSEPEPEPEPEMDSGHSPRVNDLTGARNENSVLFSLDSLSAVALGGGGGGGGGGSPAAQQPVASGPSFSVAPASSAPSQTTAQGEGSGLIDIRAMSAMLGDGGDGGGGDGGSPGSEGFGDAAIPSFGGGFGGLAAAPLSIESPDKEAPIVAPEPVKSSNGPLYALIGVLALGLLGITGYVITRPPPEGKTTEIIKVVEAGGGGSRDEDDKKKKSKDEDEDEGDDEGDDDGSEEAADSSGSSSKKKSSGKKKKKTGGTAAAGDKPAGDAGTKEPAPKKEEKKEPEDVSVDCLLDPSKCKKSGGSKSGGSGGG